MHCEILEISTFTEKVKFSHAKIVFAMLYIYKTDVLKTYVGVVPSSEN